MNKHLKILVRYLSAFAWKDEIGTCDGLAKLKKLCMDEKAMELELETDPDMAMWIAKSFAALVAKAPNYTEMQFKLNPRYHGKWEFLTVTIQKFNGKTPHQLRREAEDKLEELKRLYDPPQNQTIGR